LHFKSLKKQEAPNHGRSNTNERRLQGSGDFGLIDTASTPKSQPVYQAILKIATLFYPPRLIQNNNHIINTDKAKSINPTTISGSWAQVSIVMAIVSFKAIKNPIILLQFTGFR